MTVEIHIPDRPDVHLEAEWDTGLIRDFASGLRSTSTQIDDLGVLSTGSAVIGDWEGDDADAYHAAAGTVGGRAEASAQALRRVSLDVDAHAEALDDLGWRRDDLHARRDAIHAEIGELEVASGAASIDDVGWLADWSRNISGRIEVLEADVAGWRNDLAAAEQAMVHAFEQLQTEEQVRRFHLGGADLAEAALLTLPSEGSAAENRAWWDGLSTDEQLAVILAAPGTIGNLAGVPAWARSQANEARMQRDIADWEQRLASGTLSEDERAVVEQHLQNALAAQDALHNARERIDPVTGEPVVAQLHTYDPTAFGGDGSVAISIGDLDTADNVGVTVPGLTSDMQSIGGNTESAGNLHDAARAMHPDQSTAVLAWIDYDAPSGHPLTGDSAGVVREDLARAGGARLADTLDGLRASRPDDPAHLVAIGHSYGGTTLAHALSSHDVDVDAAAVIGAPGMGPAQTVADLDVPEGRFYVGRNSDDPVANLGDKGWINKGTFGDLGLGRDPAEDKFGGVRFQAEDPGRDQLRTRSWDLLDIPGLTEKLREDHQNSIAMHTNYYDPNTESLWNLSQILTGHHDDVMLADHVRDPWYSGWVDPEADARVEQPRTDEVAR